MSSDPKDFDPEEFESWVLDYLLLEYGEKRDDPNALKLEDLNYEGARKIDGATHHCWSYSSAKTWASLQIRGKSQIVGIIANPDFKGEVSYEHLLIEVWGRKSKLLRVPLKLIENEVWETENQYVIALNSGENIGLYAEVLIDSSPCDYMLTITHGEKKITIHGESKGLVNYFLDDNTGVSITVGVDH